jgi:site-specific DNA-methyltransferase (cytosine-N4-specific)
VTSIESAADARSFFREQGYSPYYFTQLGDAYIGDSKELLAALPSSSVSLVITSPPFALRRKKNYGNVDAEDYVDWFRPFAREVLRVLKEDGSFVVEIGGAWMPGHPTRSIYHYELLIDLVRNVEFHLILTQRVLAIRLIVIMGYKFLLEKVRSV